MIIIDRGDEADFSFDGGLSDLDFVEFETTGVYHSKPRPQISKDVFFDSQSALEMSKSQIEDWELQEKLNDQCKEIGSKASQYTEQFSRKYQDIKSKINSLTPFEKRLLSTLLFNEKKVEKVINIIEDMRNLRIVKEEFSKFLKTFD